MLIPFVLILWVWIASTNCFVTTILVDFNYTSSTPLFNLYVFWTDANLLNVFMLLILTVYNASVLPLVAIYSIDSHIIYNCFSITEGLELLNFNDNQLLMNSLNNVHPALFYITFINVIHGLFLNTYDSNNSSPYLFSLLLTSMMLGSWWAFQEGSWGGWWDWDPSEVFIAVNLFYYIYIIHLSFSSVNSYKSYLLSLILVLLTVVYYYILQINFFLTNHNFGNVFFSFFNNFFYNIIVNSLSIFLLVIITLNSCFNLLNVSFNNFTHIYIWIGFMWLSFAWNSDFLAGLIIDRLGLLFHYNYLSVFTLVLAFSLLNFKFRIKSVIWETQIDFTASLVSFTGGNVNSDITIIHLLVFLAFSLLVLNSRVSVQSSLISNFFNSEYNPYWANNFEIDLLNLFNYHSLSQEVYSNTIITDSFIDNILYILNYVENGSLKFDVGIVYSNTSLSQMGLFFNIHQSIIFLSLSLIYYVSYSGSNLVI